MKKQTNIPLNAVSVEDPFWGKVQTLVREVVIPYQYDVLEDKNSDVEKSGAVENFRIAAGESKGEFYGFVFQDSDVAKWLEAASYSLAIKPDESLSAKADELIRLIGKAQLSDGYVDTHFIIKEPDGKWKNLRDNHELYCAGHLIEAGVAHYLSTKKKTLLEIVCKTADLICARFGKGESQVRGYPGHEEIELALLRLYRVTGKKEYLDTARYFIDERGQQPSFFEEERKRRNDNKNWLTDEQYHQSHLPVREQKSAVGHSVRAMYLYTAMADLACETGDDALYKACCALLENIMEKKLYITGGLGSTFHGEAFSPAYDLPNDTVYAETCASVGMCFFARKMLEIEPDGKIADLIERELFNTVLASMQLDGKRFNYVNPLDVIPGISGVSPTHKHALPQRPKWHACACCPPNVARLLLSLGRYAWGEGNDTVYAHFFLGGSAQFSICGGVNIECESRYPWEGAVRYTVKPVNSNANFTFAVHIPQWCRNTQCLVNGNIISTEIKNGYAYINRKWNAGDIIEINCELPVLKIFSNLAVRENAGNVCLQKGPIIYCFEEYDNGAQLAALRLPENAKIKAVETADGIFKGMVLLTAEGLRETGETCLYSEKPPVEKPAVLKAIPYFTWGNRKEGEMRVWIRK